MIDDILLFGVDAENDRKSENSFDIVGLAITGRERTLIIAISLSSENDDQPVEASLLIKVSDEDVDISKVFARLSSFGGLPYYVKDPVSLYELFPSMGQAEFDRISIRPQESGTTMEMPHESANVIIRQRGAFVLELKVEVPRRLEGEL